MVNKLAQTPRHPRDVHVVAGCFAAAEGRARTELSGERAGAGGESDKTARSRQVVDHSDRQAGKQRRQRFKISESSSGFL